MRNVAFLWDESFLWGLMAYKALKGLNLPFDLIRAEDIKAGILDRYEMLFVPGGWASNKSKALGDVGIKAIQRFVAEGGNYLGLCGGAGLALNVKGGLSLLPVTRKPTKERVPSFSGRISLNINEHPIWNGLAEDSNETNPPLPPFTKGGRGGINPSLHHSITPSLVFHAWWPSQFLIMDGEIVNILATYGHAEPDSFSSDLNVGDIDKSNVTWDEIEGIYGINLDPERIYGEPAVIEGKYGDGRIVLSLLHFDTPQDKEGQQVLRNLWEYLTKKVMSQELGVGLTSHVSRSGVPPLSGRITVIAKRLEAAAREIISLGERNFLWFWQNPMLLQWRRGVRGLEYCTLYVMTKEIAEILKRQNTDKNNLYSGLRVRSAENSLVSGFCDLDSKLETNLSNIRELLLHFVDRAKRLLILERYALQRGPLAFEKCDDPEVQSIRNELFTDSKSHGGMFKELIDRIDSLLFLLLKQHMDSNNSL